MPAIKRFTPAEASRTLPLVKKIVEDIIEIGHKVREMYDNGIPQPEIDRKTHEITNLLDELKEIGCEYKDWSFDIGLIDFPSIINGRDVYLCWKSDEPSLIYYHGIHEGFAGRKKIPEELLKEND